MTHFPTCGYTSDNEQINDEQIQYTYLDEEIAPVEGLENHGFGLVDIEEYERVRDQAEDLDGRNWELQLKCKAYEMELRILQRSIPERIRDSVLYLKEVITHLNQRVTAWIKWMYLQATGDALVYPTLRRYQDMLEARYSPYNLHQE